jgi:hypothetical protein
MQASNLVYFKTAEEIKHLVDKDPVFGMDYNKEKGITEKIKELVVRYFASKKLVPLGVNMAKSLLDYDLKDLAKKQGLPRMLAFQWSISMKCFIPNLYREQQEEVATTDATT